MRGGFLPQTITTTPETTPHIHSTCVAALSAQMTIRHKEQELGGHFVA